MRRSSQALACILLLVLSFHFSFGQVTADFTANVTEGCGSLQVSFADLSSSTDGNIVAWSWDLVGANSSSQNPGRIYGVPGCYDICLTATDSDGNTATECKPCFIHVFELPEPDFVAEPEAGCSSLTVNFIDQSASADGNISQWIWGLGGSSGVVVDDGTLPEISSFYNIPDNYTISLTVQDDNGCINTITKENYVYVAPDPVVDFSAITTFSCTNPFIVNFTNNSNTQNMAYEWDFGNGTIFNGTNPPPVVYNDFGGFTPCVIGTDTLSGCSDTLCLVDYIQIGHPIEFSHSVDSGCEDLNVTFTDNSMDAASSVIWDFGTGDSSTVANPSYTFTDPGCYTVTLTRTVNGCTALETSDVCIDVFPRPTLDYTADNPIGCTVPHTVQFAASSDIGVNWIWDFGNGDQSTEQNPSYTYMEMGTYTVSLTVFTDEGCPLTRSSQEIRIEPIEALIPTSDTIQGCTPLDVNLTSISTSPTPITGWEWQVINNNATPPVIVSSMDEVPNLTLIDTGIYEIRLIVTNDIGCIDTSSFQELIAVGQPPEMAFTADPLESCVESIVSFVGQTSENTNDWLWEFGDGGFGYGETPEHEYVDTGFFDITLYAYHHGCENQLTKDSFIRVLPPIAGFTPLRFCTNPYVVQMSESSIGADSIAWDFGIDGIETDTSSEREPIFTYPTTGDFLITQTVFNFETGCSDDIQHIVRIRDLEADFTVVSPLDGCVPLTIRLENNSQDVATYSWTAPGAVISDPSAVQPTFTYNTPGMFSDIQLIARDVNGCLDTMIFQQTITANGVNANFTLDPTDGCRPLTVNFTDISTSAFGTINDWTWGFEGGAENQNVQNPTAVFENIGTYRIRLIVTDDWGCTDMMDIPDGVDVTYPLVDFTADTLSCTDLTVSFTNRTVGKGLSYLWDFGDGSSSTVANPSHLYSTEGVYSICLTATDVNGCDSTFCRTDYITVANPVAGMTSDSTFATCPPLIVNFENQSLHSNQFVWDFGDSGGTSTLDNPPHVYTQPGSYGLTLISSFNGFCADTLFVPDYIQVEGPVGSFTFDIDSACVPAVVTFYGESIDFYNYTWDFGNGVLDTTLNVIADTVSYEYDMVGKFIPKLILEDFNRCARAFESPDTIQLEELNLEFAATDSILCTGEDQTTFLNFSQSSLPINSIEWVFDGGNPGSSTELEPTVTYDSPGLFDVMLIGTNGFCTDTLIDVGAIKVGETPIAAFSMNDTLGCPPFSVTFSDQSTVNTGFIAGWEWDYGDNSTSSVQNPTHVFDVTGDFEVNLTVTTDIGCTDDVVNTISTFPLPEVEVPEPYNICIGNSVELEVDIISDPTDLTFEWLADPTLSCTNCLNPIASPLDTTIYYFVVTNPIGCADTSEVMVDVRPFPAPIVNMTSDTTICANSLIQIVADGGANIYEYQWDQASEGLSCYENCFNPIATPEMTTTYTVSVTNEFACQTIREVEIEVLDERQPFAGPDKTICEGNSTQLNIDFGNDPVWENPEGLNCTYCPDPMASPEETTTYVISVTTDFGCEIQDTLVINVLSDEDMDAGTDNVICLGETIELDAFGTGQISWAANNSLSAEDIINPVASPTTPTTYQLTIVNDECTMVDSVMIDVVELAEVFAENQTICLGEGVELEAYGSAETFAWSPIETLSDPNVFNPVASPTETTTYQVRGTLGTCQDGTAEVTVTVVPGPTTFLTEIYDFFPGQTVELDVTTEEFEAYTYDWSPVELVSCVSCNNPEITPDSTMLLTVTVTDPDTECWTVDSTIVRRQDNCPTDLIGVPNIFTPNNDGNNDELTLHLSPAVQPTGIEVFRIFDRWGAQVFESRDAGDAWDGTYKGMKMPSGVYVYYIEAPCPVGEGKMMKKGDITLLR